MNTMLMTIFSTTSQALKGVMDLKDLHRAGEIKLYTTAVIAKDASGTISVKQAAEREWEHMVYGLLIGILLGMWGGPIGLVIGGAIGSLAGLTLDLAKAGISADFLEEASRSLAPGKAALLAELDETLEAYVDGKLVKLEGRMYRRPRSEFVDNQLMDELDRIEAEWS
jgi:uncharacterized membrane protein